MRIKDIIEAKKQPQVKSPKSVVGKHKHNGNYDADKFKGKRNKEEKEKTVREQVEEAVAEGIA